MKQSSLFLLLIFGSLSGAATAQTVIRSVDEEGHVTFSDRPVADPNARQEAIRLQVGQPSDQEADAAQQRHREMREAADKLQAERERKETERRQREEQRRKRELEQPQVIVIEKEQGHPYFWPGGPVRPVRPIKPGQPGIRPPGQRPPGQRPPMLRPPVQRPPAGRPPAAMPRSR